MNMQEFKDQLAIEIFGISCSQAHAKGICIDCKEPPVHANKREAAEYTISGLCNSCYEKICAIEEE